MNRLLAGFLLWASCSLVALLAQGPVSGFPLKKGELAVAASWGYEHYDRYFNEGGSEARELTARSWSLFVEAGTGARSSLIVTLPYVRTQGDNRGWQDASLWFKYQNVDNRAGRAAHRVFTAVGGSFPLSRYPVGSSRAIGQRAFSGQGRLLYQYQHDDGWFLHLQSGIDFQLQPDSRASWPLLLRSGYGAPWFYVEGWLERVLALDSNGSNSPALAGVGSSWTRTGLTLYVPVRPWLGVVAGGAWILSGTYIGQSARFNTGLVFKAGNP